MSETYRRHQTAPGCSPVCWDRSSRSWRLSWPCALRICGDLLSEFTASDVWPWVTGAFILMGGIAIVAFHQLWRGAAAIIVSVLGWLLVVRGIILIAFPDIFASLADRMIGAVGAWKAVYVGDGPGRAVPDLCGLEAGPKRAT